MYNLRILPLLVSITALFADVLITEITDPQNSSDAGRYVELYNNSGSDVDLTGYELVRSDEYPNEDFPAISDGKYAGVIGHGGLVLTRVPEEIARQRQTYFEKQAQDQVDALDNDLMKEQDKRMPIDIDKQSRTFGGKR